ncbi:MAG: sigma-70 family RNA polymerase sigma factor [Clostridia bacterium]|nr:sigma-70 family RNA polymerase sigma factor [Clostridia bacterium]
MTDEELVLRAKAGEKEAMEELMKRYRYFVKAKARKFFLIGGEQEDLVQEGMFGLYEAITAYNKGSSFRTFASLCVERKIIDAVKASNRFKNKALNTSVSIEETLLETTDNPERYVLDSENRQEMLARMSRALSPFEFQIVVLYMDGLSCQEIADSLQKPYKSIDNGLQRAKNKLKKEMS